jgi:hypothetical protein
LNLDGDTSDLAIIEYDALSHSTLNPHLATRYLAADEDRFATIVTEVDQNQDLNGDGSLNGAFLFVARASHADFVNTNLACEASFFAFENLPQFQDGRVLVNVAESDPAGVATDLNGDGDVLDTVPVVHDLRSGQNHSLGVALYPLQRAVLFGQYAAVAVDEFAQNGTDLNGDGDTADRVVHVADLAAQSMHNLGIVNSTSSGGSTGLFARHGQLYVGVPEDFGGPDLNGDGDFLDVVVHAYDAPAHVLTNLGLATFAPMPWFTTRGFGFAVHEPSQGAIDRNGDLDAFDHVAAFYSFATRTTTNLSLAAPTPTVNYDPKDEHGYAFVVAEQAQGASDLNLDGDTIDEVPFFYDPLANAISTLGLASSTVTASNRYATVSVSEFAQGGIDLNGDGDSTDRVLHAAGPIY